MPRVKMKKCDFSHLWYFQERHKKLSPCPVSVTTGNTSINWIFSEARQIVATKMLVVAREERKQKNVHTPKTSHDTVII